MGGPKGPWIFGPWGPILALEIKTFKLIANSFIKLAYYSTGWKGIMFFNYGILRIFTLNILQSVLFRSAHASHSWLISSFLLAGPRVVSLLGRSKHGRLRAWPLLRHSSILSVGSKSPIHLLSNRMIMRSLTWSSWTVLLKGRPPISFRLFHDTESSFSLIVFVTYIAVLI